MAPKTPTRTIFLVAAPVDFFTSVLIVHPTSQGEGNCTFHPIPIKKAVLKWTFQYCSSNRLVEIVPFSHIQTILSVLESHQIMPSGSWTIPPVRNFTLPRKCYLCLYCSTMQPLRQSLCLKKVNLCCFSNKKLGLHPLQSKFLFDYFTAVRVKNFLFQRV